MNFTVTLGSPQKRISSLSSLFKISIETLIHFFLPILMQLILPEFRAIVIYFNFLNRNALNSYRICSLFECFKESHQAKQILSIDSIIDYVIITELLLDELEKEIQIESAQAQT